jgi:NAD+ synthase (glutamine-hydrolysing)
MKVYIAQQNYHIGNFLLNRERMLGEVEIARQHGADLIVFSELSVCGYPPRDFLEFEDCQIQSGHWHLGWSTYQESTARGQRPFQFCNLVV